MKRVGLDDNSCLAGTNLRSPLAHKMDKLISCLCQNSPETTKRTGVATSFKKISTEIVFFVVKFVIFPWILKIRTHRTSRGCIGRCCWCKFRFCIFCRRNSWRRKRTPRSPCQTDFGRWREKNRLRAQSSLRYRRNKLGARSITFFRYNRQNLINI